MYVTPFLANIGRPLLVCFTVQSGIFFVVMLQLVCPTPHSTCWCSNEGVCACIQGPAQVVPLSFSVAPPTLQNYDVATELVARGVAMWSSTEEEEEEEEGENKKGDGRGEEEDVGEADVGDWEEKAKDNDTKEKSLQVGRRISSEGGENSMEVAMTDIAASVPPQTQRNLVGIGGPGYDQDASSHEVHINRCCMYVL